MTGAAMVEAVPAVRPRFIAIETNTLSRGIDQAMVERVRTSNCATRTNVFQAPSLIGRVVPAKAER